MTPYYSHAGIEIYHGDCREILPQLGHVDAVITDPPYGVSFEGKATKHTAKKSGGYAGGLDDADIGPTVIQLALSSCCSRAVVFPGIRRMFAYPEPDDIGCVYCPSGAGIGRWGFTCFHPVLFYGTRASTTLRPSSVVSFATSEKSGHPCPKPNAWLLWAVALASIEGQVIADPFMGSGTTLVAARQLGRHAIGIEISREYCDIAIQRLSQEILPLEPCAPEPEQTAMFSEDLPA